MEYQVKKIETGDLPTGPILKKFRNHQEIRLYWEDEIKQMLEDGWEFVGTICKCDYFRKPKGEEDGQK